ncbi:MAG: glycosyltransferase family 39 protein [Magnetococcales bacterium]|nr:glycosyltransferase family 39 protein [Magnetococcales bacterium]
MRNNSAESTNISGFAIAALMFVMAVHLFFLWQAQPGFQASDDLAYAYAANNILHNKFQLAPGHFLNRFGVTVPTALSYSLFGVNNYSTVLWPIVCSLIMVVTLYFTTLRIFGVASAFFAAFLLAINPAQIKFAVHLGPDIVVSMALFLVVVTLYFARSDFSERSSALLGTLLSLFFYLAVLAKLTAVWVLPFLFLVFIRDMFNRQHLELWVWICSSAVLFGVVFFGLYYIYTGDPLYRLTGIEQGVNLVARYSYQHKPAIELIKRLTVEPVAFLFKWPEVLILMVLAVPVTFSSVVAQQKIVRYWLVFVLVVFAMFWFGSTSLSHYNPITMLPRMLLPILPALSILAGVVLAKVFITGPVVDGRRVVKLLLAFFMVILLAITVGEFGRKATFQQDILFTTFSLWLFYLISHPVLKNHFIYKFRDGLPALAMVCACFVAALFHVNGGLGETNNQRSERFIVENFFIDQKKPTAVFMDKRSVVSIPFFLGFKEQPKLRLIHWEEIPENLEEGSRILVLINSNRITAMNALYSFPIPDFAKKPPSDWNLLWSGGRVALYEVDDVRELM